ncbi:N-formylglutamate deformylase [Thalassococcus sp. S3]|uniref:N-formylglutamate deformylase n=1 Tax=Thalassococcus sp. S3 TaxID=2017482 RepID=UPI0010246CAE|nr:N-formylglutamate deformylase [Thalassococcus sp. S3]QBF32892.1 N-formylglutamate deformylase [Thalassococcus sp. S3]
MIEVTRGGGPLVLGMPHTGLEVPAPIWARLNERGQALADTDWHIDRLYGGLRDDVTIVRTQIHRYVVDVNRSPEDESLYPGQNTTGLCPLTDFDGLLIYRAGQEPDAAECAERCATYHLPYHSALLEELERVQARHGIAILYDCHSIRSRIPYLFGGDLPDLNIGTNLSTSCSPLIERQVADLRRAAAPGYSTVLNGRFKGGWTTRHYGRPEQGLHAVQMELAQRTYMTETAPWAYDPSKAYALRQHLSLILNALSELVETGALE